MPLARRHHGPAPHHPVAVVPDDPARRGALVTVRGWEVAVADPVDEVTSVEALSAAADDVRWDAPDRPAGPPFDGGLVGVVTDDVAAALLDLDPVDPRPAPAPLHPLWFGAYRHAACQDPDGGWWVTGRTRADLDRAAALLEEAAAAPAPGSRPPSPATGVVTATTDRAAHARSVERIRGWIADGDVYQVNLTLHVGAPWDGPPRDLALRLFGASHGAAHAALLHLPGLDGGDVAVTSVSPETFLRTDGRRAAVRPIKGTRARSARPAEDRRLADDLVAAAKDAAEHVMIVDLERNDLGRIARTGSVAVPELMALEAHPTVWHLTSTVTADLRPGVDLGDALAALFPCGSVTGAPKRMAVARTRLVEPWRRGAYCGAIGVVSRGLVDLSVGIRTAVAHDGRAWYGTGGGIVADSDPDAEWAEAMAKAAAFFTATGTRPPGGP